MVCISNNIFKSSLQEWKSSMSANLQKYALILTFIGVVLAFYPDYIQDSADRQNAANVNMC
jgi:glucose uptake protein GlcU